MNKVTSRRHRMICLCLVTIQICWLIAGQQLFAETHSYEYDEPTVISPERGFYKIYRIDKYGYPQSVNLAKDRDFLWVRKTGSSLISARVSLEQFRREDLPSSFLAQLQAGFDAVRAGGVKVILRFAYNLSSQPGEDTSLSWTLKHIAQLKGLLRKNADVIAVVQAGFVGAWGEWHSSRHGLDNKDARGAVLSALLDALPTDRSVQLRYPQHKQELIGEPVNETTASSNSPSRRVGHHNDCIFASKNDLTYPLESIDYFSDYVARDGVYVPVGGETCKVYPPRTNCAVAVRELRRLHYSYLNDNYLQEVVDGWKREGCYGEIASHLGYQISLRQAVYDEIATSGTEFPIELTVENKGWAAPFNPRWLLVTMESSEGQRLTTQLTPDARMIRPGAITILKGTLQLPREIEKGRYALYLSAPDPAPNLQPRQEYVLPFFNKGYLIKEARLPLGYIDVTN